MQMVHMKQETFPFLKVELNNGIYTATYDPFQSFLDKMPDVTFEILPAAPAKPTCFVAYQVGSESKIIWQCKVLSSPVEDLFEFRLKEFIDGKKDMRNAALFGKAVGMLIKFNPHIGYDCYGSYIDTFRDWALAALDNDIPMVADIEMKIVDELSSCIYKKDKEAMSLDDIMKTVMIHSAYLTWQDCSQKSCNELKKLNMDATKYATTAKDFQARAAQIRAEAAAKRAAARKPPTASVHVENALKRKREEEEKKDGEDNLVERWDPKDGELLVIKMKSEETLMKV